MGVGGGGGNVVSGRAFIGIVGHGCCGRGLLVDREKS